ncbi:prepilin peptidase [Candidatus Parcubacteria bacterium]|nr:MAG: prepilin peptidase [Candidatus Parcubacteria bacterium]
MTLVLVFGSFGLIVGSFLNVLVLREGKETISGRSVCPSCRARIRSHDLVPVLSWVLLGGRCRDCKARISLQYPLVELSTAVLFALIGAAPIELPFKLVALPIAALLLAIAVHDLRTTIIPDRWVLMCGILTLSAALFGVVGTGASYAFAVLAGPLTALPLFLLWLVSDGKWMGLGDSKLALSIGWLLGIEGGLIAVLFAFILGAAVSLPLLAMSSDAVQGFVRTLIPIPAFRDGRMRFTMKSEVPFGPFLVASCLIVWFAHLYALPLPL